MTSVEHAPGLGPYLDDLVTRYHRAEYLCADPLVVARAYDDPRDREVAAFFAAAFAYGRVAQIVRSARTVLERLGPRPAATLRDAEARDLRRRLAGVKHRFNDADDIALVAWLLGQALRAHGSLGAHFAAVAPSSMADEFDLPAAAARWMAALRSFDARPLLRTAHLPERHSARYLLPAPEKGSACKRLYLFFRWMARPDDGIDLGLWRHPAPHDLLMPVDTHVLRIARHLGLTERRDASLRTAREITVALRRLAPDDPTRYDFALSHLGIVADCPTRERLERCLPCALRPVCRRHAELAATAPAARQSKRRIAA